MAKANNSYRSLISKDEKELQAEEVDMKVSEARLATESSLHSAKTTLIHAKSSLKSALAGKGGFSVRAILEAEDALVTAQETIDRIKALKASLFGGESED